jgi:hypothetical protein
MVSEYALGFQQAQRQDHEVEVIPKITRVSKYPAKTNNPDREK